MPERLKVAVAGLGRMGQVHARQLLELQRDTGTCEVVALVDPDESCARRFIQESGCTAPVFDSVTKLAEARLCQAAVIATPTETHREHAEALISAGCRVLLEKPLTGTLDGDETFAGLLDREHPDAVMLGFQRRFDSPLQLAKQLMESGSIGRVFKIYSALEDSAPPPDGYQSNGILSDMSVHNVDEILWLTGRMPSAVAAIGSRLYGHKVSTCVEDFDDALMILWFPGELMAQVQVSRNHVSGYRVETVIYGEEGQIHMGRFDQNPVEIAVEAFGRRGRTDPIAHRTFSMGTPVPGAPEFLDRFAPAYKEEKDIFVKCCLAGEPFPVTHRDALRAQQVISAAMRGVMTEATQRHAHSAFTG